MTRRSIFPPRSFAEQECDAAGEGDEPVRRGLPTKPRTIMKASDKIRLPIPVTKADTVLGGMVNEILPPYSKIPDEFKKSGNKWVEWQSRWFFKGLKSIPEPKEGIDGSLAMANLSCVQGSFEPKHEHKQAGVAYLASLWFKEPSE